MDMPWHQLLHRQVTTNKYDYGHVLIIGGSAGMGGAPILAGRAALRVGAGLVTIVTPDESLTGHDVPDELMTVSLPSWDAVSENIHTINTYITEHHVTVLIIGPGLPPVADAFIRTFLATVTLPVVIDARCFTALSGRLDSINRLGKQNGDVIITPHTGEYNRISPNIPPKELAQKYGITVVLKQHETNVFDPKGASYVNHTGNPGLATAGSGDVLSGMIAGMLAQHYSTFESAVMAVELHGRAGDIAATAKTEPGIIASDIIEAIPDALVLMETI
jgi:hydroxyethylthiazole kinase-like uncharacterized protein yjeF